MILEISNTSQKVTVEIANAGGKRKIRLGDTEILCDWVRLADGHYSLILDGRVFDLMVNLDTDTCKVMSRAGTYSFRITDPRRSETLPHSEEGLPGLQRVCAEMPGKIIRVLVQEGEPVTYDQGLLVLEAMKMQNEIRSPKNGIVKEIGVAGETTVNTGDFLLSIES